jgi:hypothetical protein
VSGRGTQRATFGGSGVGRNRTGIDGFAGRCMTILPPRHRSNSALSQRLKTKKPRRYGRRGFVSDFRSGRREPCTRGSGRGTGGIQALHQLDNTEKSLERLGDRLRPLPRAPHARIRKLRDELSPRHTSTAVSQHGARDNVPPNVAGRTHAVPDHEALARVTHGVARR